MRVRCYFEGNLLSPGGFEPVTILFGRSAGVFGYEGVDDGAHVEEVGWEDYGAAVREGSEEAEDQAEALE